MGKGTRLPGMTEKKHKAVPVQLKDYLVFCNVNLFSESKKFRMIERPVE